MSADTAPRSSALGIASLCLALPAMLLAGNLLINSISVYGTTLYVDSSGFDGGATRLVLLAVCLIGIAIGVEGFQRPTQRSVLAIFGIVLNVSLFLMLFAGPLIIGTIFQWAPIA